MRDAHLSELSTQTMPIVHGFDKNGHYFCEWICARPMRAPPIPDDMKRASGPSATASSSRSAPPRQSHPPIEPTPDMQYVPGPFRRAKRRHPLPPPALDALIRPLPICDAPRYSINTYGHLRMVRSWPAVKYEMEYTDDPGDGFLVTCHSPPEFGEVDVDTSGFEPQSSTLHTPAAPVIHRAAPVVPPPLPAPASHAAVVLPPVPDSECEWF